MFTGHQLQALLPQLQRTMPFQAVHVQALIPGIVSHAHDRPLHHRPSAGGFNDQLHPFVGIGRAAHHYFPIQQAQDHLRLVILQISRLIQLDLGRRLRRPGHLHIVITGQAQNYQSLSGCDQGTLPEQHHITLIPHLSLGLPRHLVIHLAQFNHSLPRDNRLFKIPSP